MWIKNSRNHLAASAKFRMPKSSSVSSVCQVLREKLGCRGEGVQYPLRYSVVLRPLGQTFSIHSLAFPAAEAGRKRAPGPTVTSFRFLNTALVLPRALLCHCAACCMLSRLLLPDLWRNRAISDLPLVQQPALQLNHHMLDVLAGRHAPKGIHHRLQQQLHLGWEPADGFHMHWSNPGKPFPSHRQACLSLKGRNRYNLVITNTRCLFFYCNLKRSAKNSRRNKEGTFRSWLANSDCHNQQGPGDRGCGKTILCWQTATQRRLTGDTCQPFV